MTPELEWRSQCVPLDDVRLHRDDGSSDLVEQRSCTRVVGSIRSLECRNRERSSPLPTHERPRSEEHTSELQSRLHLVCRLLLEKKKKTQKDRRTVRKSYDT